MSKKASIVQSTLMALLALAMKMENPNICIAAIMIICVTHSVVQWLSDAKKN